MRLYTLTETFDFKQITDFVFPQSIKKNHIINQRILKHSLALHLDNYLLILRPGNLFGLKNFEIEKIRRINSIEYCAKNISTLCIPTTSIIVPAKYKGKPISLIGKLSSWLNDVKDIQEMPWKKILTSKGIVQSIITLDKFTIREFFKHGKAYDFFCLFSDVRNKKGRIDLRKTLVPRNIMIGYEDISKEERVFIDTDWYVMISDTPLSGFAKSSYVKRIAQGMVLLVVSTLFFSFINIFLKKQKYENIRNY